MELSKQNHNQKCRYDVKYGKDVLLFQAAYGADNSSISYPSNFFGANLNNSHDRLEPYEQLLSKSPNTITPNIYSGPVSLTNSIAYNDNDYHYAYAEHLPDFL